MTVTILDMALPASVMLVKNILTHPDVWNATRHDHSSDLDTFEPTIIGVTYALACCDGEPIGVFTFHPAGYGLLWMAHTAFYPWANGAAVAAATKEAIKMGLEVPGCRNILGMVPIYNSPAVQSTLRNGFYKYCEIPQAVRREGIWHPLILLGVVKPEDVGADRKSQLPETDAQSAPAPMQKLDITIDPEPLLKELDAHPELWDENPERRTFSPDSVHREMEDIWVRYGDKSFFYKQEEPHEPHWWDAAFALPSLYEIAISMMRHCDADELGGIWITRVPPGKQIYPHTDTGWHARHYNRKVYVILKSNDKCVNYADSLSQVMKAGSVWSFDNSITHWMENLGDTDRVTLIVCMRKE